MNADGRASPLQGVVLAQAVRLIEESGPLDDAREIRQAAQAGGSHEARLIERARLIGARLGLDAEIARWKALSPLVWLGLAVVVSLTVSGIVAAVLGGGRTINAVVAFCVALGGHLLTLVLWGLSLLWRQAGDAGALFPSFGALFLQLLARLPGARGPHAMPLARATAGVLARARLLPWSFGLISHGIWTLALLSVFAALAFALAFRAYRLTWETTLLDPQFFIDFVRFTGWLPARLGFPMPDVTTLASAGAPGSDQRAWAWWLLGCVMVYGVMPRAALTALCWAVWRAGRVRLSLDMGDPYFRKLATRLDNLAASEVVDRERPAPAAPRPAAGPAAPPAAVSSRVIGYELPPELPWPPALNATAERMDGSAAARRQSLDRLARDRPRRLLLLCHAPSTPDRGAARYLGEAASLCGETALLPVAAALAPADLARWRDWLSAAGLGRIPLFESAEAAQAWCEDNHAC